MKKKKIQPRAFAALALAIATIVIIVNRAGKVPETAEKTEAESTSTEKGTSSEEKSSETLPTADTAPEPETTAEPEMTAEKERSLPLGIYLKIKGVYTRLPEYHYIFPQSDDDPRWKRDTWTVPGEVHLIHDIDCFDIIASNEDAFTMPNYAAGWTSRWNGASLSGYRIGFFFEVFTKSGETVAETMLHPSDTFKLQDFFEVYLYDDVAHASDSWYSHTVTENANTLHTSAKLTLRSGCKDVEKIEMTAFLYKDSSEFDQSGNYLGAEKVTMTIFPQ